MSAPHFHTPTDQLRRHEGTIDRLVVRAGTLVIHLVRSDDTHHPFDCRRDCEVPGRQCCEFRVGGRPVSAEAFAARVFNSTPPGDSVVVLTDPARHHTAVVADIPDGRGRPA